MPPQLTWDTARIEGGSSLESPPEGSRSSVVQLATLLLGGLLLFLRLVGDERFRRHDEAGDGRRILQRGANHLGAIDNAVVLTEFFEIRRLCARLRPSR